MTEKKRTLTKEEKENQRNLLTKALAELNLKQKEKQINLERVTEHIKLGIPMMELQAILDKEKGILENETISELEKIKTKIELDLIQKEMELQMPILKAESQKSFLEKELKNIGVEIKSTLELLKQFR